MDFNPAKSPNIGKKTNRDSFRKGKQVTQYGKKSGITRDEAENLAIEALGFLAREPEHLGRFLAATGIGPHHIRDMASDPDFLAGVLEFLMADEPLLLTFTENARVRPTMIAAAHYLICGDPAVHG